MAGVAVNVRVTLTLEKNQRLKWCVGGNDFSLSDYKTTIARLSNNFSTPLWELYFDRYCKVYVYQGSIQWGEEGSFTPKLPSSPPPPPTQTFKLPPSLMWHAEVIYLGKIR